VKENQNGEEVIRFSPGYICCESMTLLERLKTAQLPPVLFHYTSQAGVLGILQGDCLWATKAHYLNDSSEFSHGLALISDALRERAKEGGAEPQRDKLDGVLQGMQGVQTMNVCVASLTQEGDLLSQWRAYGLYALGLKAQSLRDLAHEQGFYLAECIYAPTEKRKAINELVDEFVDRIGASVDWTGEEQGGCVALASRLALTLKHESFKEEREWRLISIPKMVSELCFRQGTSMIIPFFNLALGTNRNTYLDSVTVGPTPHAELAIGSMKMLLRKLQLTDPEDKVEGTSIPYRNW
jgi:hypothetical protein